jgi:hypothetical protein
MSAPTESVATVEALLLNAAASLAAGTGQFSISNDPTLQAQDVANAMHMKWEMCRSYYAALVGALADPSDWTPPVLAQGQQQGQPGQVAGKLASAVLPGVAKVVAPANPGLATALSAASQAIAAVQQANQPTAPATGS